MVALVVVDRYCWCRIQLRLPKRCREPVLAGEQVCCRFRHRLLLEISDPTCRFRRNSLLNRFQNARFGNPPEIAFGRRGPLLRHVQINGVCQLIGMVEAIGAAIPRDLHGIHAERGAMGQQTKPTFGIERDDELP